MSKNTKKELSIAQSKELLITLKTRFEQNMHRHKGVEWAMVQAKLERNPEKLWSLHEMENTGGEPDIVILDKKSADLVFYDCATESPKGRRSLCYDRQALDARKEHKPKNCVTDMAEAMGIVLLNEDQYRKLQAIEPLDTKTSSWIETPDEIRILGGALFMDCRFKHVFLYHNGAESYYAGRAFRGWLKI